MTTTPLQEMQETLDAILLQKQEAMKEGKRDKYYELQTKQLKVQSAIDRHNKLAAYWNKLHESLS